MFNSVSSLLDTPVYPQSKDIWGSQFWGVLHNVASNYPEHPTRTQKRKMRDLITNLIDNIPCGECKEHAKIYLKMHKVQLTNKEKLSHFLCSFHNDVNKRLGKPEVDCKLILGKEEKECKSCKLTLKDTYSGYKNSIKKIVNKRCKEAGVPIPEIEFAHCPTLPDDNEASCNLVDPNTKKGKIYFNNKTASLRSVEHEVEHWIRVQKGEIEATRNELDVDLTARARLNRDFDNDLYSKLNNNRALVTLSDTDSNDHENSGGIFSGIDSFYKPLADLTKVPAANLNDANTPEIVGYALDALGDITLTPFGNAVVNIVSGVGLVGLSMLMPELGTRDKIFLNELGAHKFWSIIRYSNPNTNRIAYQQATAAGQALSAGNINGIMSNIVQTPVPPTPAPVAKTAQVGANMSMNAGVAQTRGVNTPASMAKKSYYINHG